MGGEGCSMPFVLIFPLLYIAAITTVVFAVVRIQQNTSQIADDLRALREALERSARESAGSDQ
jgi:hypothetical protein